MNVCGGHERAIAAAGLRLALLKQIELIAGPGCPVCICPEEDVYEAMQLALHGHVVLAFGDMLRVPVNVPKSEPRSLEQAKAAGGDIRPIASPLEAVHIETTTAPWPRCSRPACPTICSCCAALLPSPRKATRRATSRYAADDRTPPAGVARSSLERAQRRRRSQGMRSRLLSVTAISSSQFDVVVVVASLGPLRAKFSGELHVLPHDDLHPPATYTLRFEGRGGITGTVRGEAQVRLEPRGADQTMLSYVARATLNGGIVQLGAHFIDRAAQELAEEFFAAFGAYVRRSNVARVGV